MDSNEFDKISEEMKMYTELISESSHKVKDIIMEVLKDDVDSQLVLAKAFAEYVEYATNFIVSSSDMTTEVIKSYSNIEGSYMENEIKEVISSSVLEDIEKLDI